MLNYNLYPVVVGYHSNIQHFRSGSSGVDRFHTLVPVHHLDKIDDERSNKSMVLLLLL